MVKIHVFDELVFFSRFEARHQFFKRVIRATNNTVNVGFTLATRYSQWWAYFTSGRIYQTGFSDMKKCHQLLPSDLSDSHADLMATANLDVATVTTSRTITFDGVEFKEDTYILLGKSDDVYMGKIERIIIHNNVLFLLIDKFRASYVENYGVYEINPQVHESLIVKSSELQYPIRHDVYMFQRKLCFALKHNLQ